MKEIKIGKQHRMMKHYIREKSLPVEVNSPAQMDEQYYKIFLKHLGFTFRYKKENQFILRFPKSWRKVAEKGLEEFCYLLDNKNRKRAAIFYKVLDKATIEEMEKQGLPVHLASQYVHITSYINWMPRYRTKIDHVIPLRHGRPSAEEIEAHYNSPMVGKVLDSETVELYSTRLIDVGVKYNSASPSDYFTIEGRTRTQLFMECESWLSARFPDYSNISKYWNEN